MRIGECKEGNHMLLLYFMAYDFMLFAVHIRHKIHRDINYFPNDNKIKSSYDKLLEQKERHYYN